MQSWPPRPIVLAVYARQNAICYIAERSFTCSFKTDIIFIIVAPRCHFSARRRLQLRFFVNIIAVIILRFRSFNLIFVVVVIVCVAVEIVYRCAVDATGAVKIADVCMRLGFGTLRHNNSLSPICRSANEKRSHQICVRYLCVLYFAQMRRTDDASSKLKTHRICRSMGKLIN